jgi:hypothetical protein
LDAVSLGEVEVRGYERPVAVGIGHSRLRKVD